MDRKGGPPREHENETPDRQTGNERTRQTTEEARHGESDRGTAVNRQGTGRDNERGRESGKAIERNSETSKQRDSERVRRPTGILEVRASRLVTQGSEASRRTISVTGFMALVFGGQ